MICDIALRKTVEGVEILPLAAVAPAQVGSEQGNLDAWRPGSGMVS